MLTKYGLKNTNHMVDRDSSPGQPGHRVKYQTIEHAMSMLKLSHIYLIN
jgi:hypothetical protein